MSEPFIGEIRIFGFNFAPTGWAQCNGQILPISQNTALFSVIGTMFGGNGTSNFGLPNLQNIAQLGAGTLNGFTYEPGEMAGEETVTLVSSQLPPHIHNVNCNSANGNQYGPPGNIWATDVSTTNEYAPPSTGTMNPGTISPAGNNQPHNNIQPYLVLNYCISLNGVYPTRG